MMPRNIWWFGDCHPYALEEFQRQSVLFVGIDPHTAARTAALVARFEHKLAVGDVVLATDTDRKTLLIGEVVSLASHRPGIRHDQVSRRMHWHAPVDAGAGDKEVWSALVALSAMSLLSGPVRDGALGLLSCVVAGQDGPSSPVEVTISCELPRVILPSLPILFQSPHAEQILRDFRWREYLQANPDVAETVDGEEHAFRHFFYHGYYERRIFDPKRLDAFDPHFYRERYAELGLANDAEAQIHYCYEGWYENRIPNRASAWLYDADLHVFQMGKVGSHTLAAALEEARYAGQVMHLHWVTDLAEGYPLNRLPYSTVLVHPREKPVQVISATREIVGWAISSLFQTVGESLATGSQAFKVMEQYFWNQCQSGLKWFDHRYFCNLDVYRHPFDHEVGYNRIRHQEIDLLIYRQEDLPRMQGPLSKFLSLDRLRLTERNIGASKVYAPLYHKVMSDFRIPRNLLARLYDSPFMQHFYSDAERERSFARWTAKG